MEQRCVCPGCSRLIAPEDTVVVAGGRLSHLDCKRPQTLSPEERLLLFRYCWDHAAAECQGCATGYRMTELTTDLFGGRELLCPRCRANLIGSVRSHLYSCAMLPATVRQRARDSRDAARRLVKQSRELGDRADVLMRELESTLRSLWETAVHGAVQLVANESKPSEETRAEPAPQSSA